MRRGFLAIGAVLALALAGCGSGGSGPSSRSSETRLEPASLAKLRGAIKHAVDANLVKLEASTKTIACVDGNIAAVAPSGR
jgi:hypothetical protein